MSFMSGAWTPPKTTKLLWLDMEMSGLDPQRDVILEVAAVVTSMDLKPLESYESVVYQSADRLAHMDEWNQTHHKASGLLAKIPQGLPQSIVEKELLLMLKRHFQLPQERPILCGNSIAQDRAFVQLHMPELFSYLHYRLLDVSSWKIIFENLYGKRFEKKKNHRALDDIQESIEELRYYLSFVTLPWLTHQEPVSGEAQFKR